MAQQITHHEMVLDQMDAVMVYRDLKAKFNILSARRNPRDGKTMFVLATDVAQDKAVVAQFVAAVKAATK